MESIRKKFQWFHYETGSWRQIYNFQNIYWNKKMCVFLSDTKMCCHHRYFQSVCLKFNFPCLVRLMSNIYLKLYQIKFAFFNFSLLKIDFVLTAYTNCTYSICKASLFLNRNNYASLEPSFHQKRITRRIMFT